MALDQVSSSQADKETTINELTEALQAAGLFGIRRSTTTGLTFGYYGGQVWNNGVLTTIANGTVALTASSTNYIEATYAGSVSKNTTGFTAGRIPLFEAVTSTTAITGLTDRRIGNTPMFGYLSKSVAGGAGTTVLTAAEARVHLLKCTGALTGNRNVELPAVPWRWVVENATSGAFTLTFKTNAGTGVAVTQGKRAVLWGDGTDIYSEMTDPTAMGLGTMASQNANAVAITGGTAAVTTLAVGVDGATPGAYTNVITLAAPAASGSTRGDFSRILDYVGSRVLDSGVSSSGAWLQSRDQNDYSVNYTLQLNPNGGSTTVGGGLAVTGTSKDSAGYLSDGLIRAEGTALHASAAGVGVELYESGGTAAVQSYNRTSSAFAPLQVIGSTVTLLSGATTVLSASLGAVDVTGTLGATSTITGTRLISTGVASNYGVTAVGSATSGYGLYVDQKNTTAADPAADIHHEGTTGDNTFVRFATEAGFSIRGSVTYNRGGGVVAYNTSSARHEKIIFGSADRQKSRDIVLNTPLREYAWRSNPTKRQIGVIADEVLASGFRGAVQRNRYGGAQGVDKTAWVFHTVGTLQLHDEDIEGMKGRLAQLERAAVAAGWALH